MNKFKSLIYLTIVLAPCGLVGCAKRNPRSISKIDVDASVKRGLPWQPQDGRVITTWVDPQNATMSTLYGHGVAVDSARSTGQRPAYPDGAMIALVTWNQREDDRWFGANIPATVQSVEFVTVTSRGAAEAEYLHQKFEGDPLRQTVRNNASIPFGRARYIVSQPAAITP